VDGAVPISAGQVQTLVTSLEARLLEDIANQARILQPAQHDQDQLPVVDPDTFAPWLFPHGARISAYCLLREFLSEYFGVCGGVAFQ